MNTQTGVADDFPAVSSALAPATISAGQRFYWTLRREFWENRSLYLAPLAVGALVVVGFSLSMLHLRSRMHDSGDLASIQAHGPMQQPFEFAAMLIMAIEVLVAVFYCLDALYGERRDRSILFWKSLPVSDLTTVLAKASIPTLVLPLIAFGTTIVTQALMLLLGATILMGSGVSATAMGFHLSLLPGSLMLLYHLVAIHGLWYAPVYGWLLLVSAWVRRAPFLWATLPVLAVSVVEKIAFNTSYVASAIANRVVGGAGRGSSGGSMAMESLVPPNAGHFLLSPGMWLGFALTAAFLAGAVRLRRYRSPV